MHYSGTSSRGGSSIMEGAWDGMESKGGDAMNTGDIGGDITSIAEAFNPTLIPISKSCHTTTISMPLTSVISSTPGTMMNSMGSFPLMS